MKQMRDMKKVNKLQQLCCLAISLLIVSSLAIVKYGEWMGVDLKAKAEVVVNDTLRTLKDGSMVINTSSLASDISGYAGKVPLEIIVKDDKVQGVKALPNDETDDFFNEASKLLSKWNGKTIDDALNMKVDAVSGATFSSKAIIGNMQRGLDYAKTVASRSALSSTTESSNFECSAKNILGLFVVLMAAILPLFIKNKKYLFLQLILNIVVLGFWCGSFLSYTALLGYTAHGISIMSMLIQFIMIVIAFLYPLLGKKSYYCTHVCPFGSLQHVAGQCVRYKVRMNQNTLRRLDTFRQVVWALLMLCIWSGVWVDWIDYEPFTAFVFHSASWAVITLATVFVLLSFVVTRPYCRFVCPVGTLLRISQNIK